MKSRRRWCFWHQTTAATLRDRNCLWMVVSLRSDSTAPCCQQAGLLFKGGPMRVEGKIEFTILEQERERVISEMPIQPGILNPYGVVHAGAILWFADVTATVLAMGSTNAGERMTGFPLAISLNANFAGNQRAGK